MPSKEMMERMMKAQSLRDRGMTLREIAGEMDLSPSTVWKYLNYDEWKEKQKKKRQKEKTLDVLEDMWEEGKLTADFDFKCYFCGEKVEKGEPSIKIVVHPSCLRDQE